MRKPLSVIAIALFSTMVHAQNWSNNPIITHMYSADPSAHVFGDTLWLYPSHDKDDATSFSMEDYHAYSTTDMKHWQDHGVIFNPIQQTSWAKSAAWAPDCIFRNGKYYLYYPTDKRHIGVAVGDSPAGPFHDPLGHPLISIDSPGVVCDRDFIDPCVFIDTIPASADGQGERLQAYLFMGQNTVCCIKLNDDMISYDGNVYIIKGVKDFFEAVWVHKHNSIYYMSYSDGPFHGHEPQIAYCTSTSPLGPYTYQGVILDPVNSGTNHHSIVNYKGQDYLFYHTADISRILNEDYHCGVRRNVCCDSLFYNADGTIRKVSPTLNDEKLQLRDIPEERRLALVKASKTVDAKVAIVSKKVKGRYYTFEPGSYPIISSIRDEYEIGIGQDADTIPKTACTTETWTAMDGHGYVWVDCAVKTNVNVRESPNVDAPVIAKLHPEIEGDIPEPYVCLGKQGDWFKIETSEGKVGYVLSRFVEWCISDPDCGGCIR